MTPEQKAREVIDKKLGQAGWVVQDISIENGYDGVLVFKAKTSELVEYYIREFGASHAGSYDPFRLVIWEDAAQALIEDFERSN